MKIIVLAGGLSTERDVSLASAAGICRTLLERGHDAFLLDVFLGLENAPENLEDVFTMPGHGLEIAGNISEEEPDLAAVKASRPDQSDCFLGPNVIELCRLADITFLGLHGGEGENGKLQATFDLLGIRYTGPDSLGCAVAMDKGFTKAGISPVRDRHTCRRLPAQEYGGSLSYIPRAFSARCGKTVLRRLQHRRVHCKYRERI